MFFLPHLSTDEIEGIWDKLIAVLLESVVIALLLLQEIFWLEFVDFGSYVVNATTIIRSIGLRRRF